MLSKMKALWGVFKQGQMVSNPKAWKQGQISVTAFAGFLIALVQLGKEFGLDIPLDAETTTAVAASIITLVNVVLTVCTSKTVGLPSNQQGVHGVQQDVIEETQELSNNAVSPLEHSGIDNDVRERAKQWARPEEQPNWQG